MKAIPRCFRVQFPLVKLLCLIITLAGCSENNSGRHPDALLLDEAEIFTEIQESVADALVHIRNDYGIEVVVATMNSSSPDETLQETSARLFTQWNIGREFGGHGLLLLLDNHKKEVRIEVGFTLEAIFTDLLTGYIEEKQLPSYFLSDQLEIGLIAVLEEIEARSQLKALDADSPDIIKARDLAFLSGGGGAEVDLSEYKSITTTPTTVEYPAGRTAEEAWQILLQSWHDKNRNPDIGVYTPITRLIYRAYTNQPDRRFEEDIRTWGDKPYEIISDDNYAVVFFGNIKGWENAPFLFCRTTEGWQFDMVHQRKIVRMGKAPHWGIERWEHPYITLLSRCPFWMGQDMPRRHSDRYRVQDDAFVVDRILALESTLRQHGDDFKTLVELGTLYTLTSMGKQRISLLSKAHQAQPEDPDVLYQLAIAHVDAHYQYKTASRLMEQYVELLPQDAMGYFFLGYLALMQKDYDRAIDVLQKGLSLDPRSLYGRCKLARSYAARGEEGDRELASRIVDELEQTDSNHIRVKWLRQKIES